MSSCLWQRLSWCLWLSEERLETEEEITQDLSGLCVCGRAEVTEERTTQELHYQQAGRGVSDCQGLGQELRSLGVSLHWGGLGRAG